MGGAIERIYVEEGAAEHPRAVEICRRFPRAERILCRRYGEVFNPRAQDFRLQKRRPALILAEKFDHFVLPTPAGYGIGGRRNFYFSHALNCIYDCRYCFLQGMFRSASYVVFVNYEDFFAAVDARLAEAPDQESWFFSGYDCDSLALDRVTGFAGQALSFFAGRPRARLELRTKSTRVAALLAREPFAGCVVAFSLTPEETRRRLEPGVPSLERRLRAMEALGERGWPLGLRFDPVLWDADYRRRYRRLFRQVFSRLDGERIHSASLGGFRLPAVFHRRMVRLLPSEPLLAGPLEEAGGLVTYRLDLEREMLGFCAEELRRYLPGERIFSCG